MNFQARKLILHLFQIAIGMASKHYHLKILRGKYKTQNYGNLEILLISKSDKEIG